MSLLACTTTRKVGQYGAPIALSSEEAAWADARLEESGAIEDTRERCLFWARLRPPGVMHGAGTYAAEMAKTVCQNDPGHRYRHSVEEREAWFMKNLAGYAATGDAKPIQPGIALIVPFERAARSAISSASTRIVARGARPPPSAPACRSASQQGRSCATEVSCEREGRW
jgi:hypothetical protein